MICTLPVVTIEIKSVQNNTIRTKAFKVHFVKKGDAKHFTKENCSDTTRKCIMLLLNASRMLLIWMLLFLLFTFVSNFTFLATRHSTPPQDSPVVHVEFLFGTLLLLIRYQMLHPISFLTLLLYRMFSHYQAFEYSHSCPKVIFNTVNLLLIILLILCSCCKSSLLHP